MALATIAAALTPLVPTIAVTFGAAATTPVWPIAVAVGAGSFIAGSGAMGIYNAFFKKEIASSVDGVLKVLIVVVVIMMIILSIVLIYMCKTKPAKEVASKPRKGIPFIKK